MGPRVQVLGRQLEGLVTAAEELKKQWKDSFVSVEHLVVALADDPRFGAQLLRNMGCTKVAIETAVKDIRGTKRVLGIPLPACPVHSLLLGTS